MEDNIIYTIFILINSLILTHVFVDIIRCYIKRNDDNRTDMQKEVDDEIAKNSRELIEFKMQGLF